MNKNIWILLAAATIIRFVLAALFPITADESYYWLWAKHLSLSYVDHPPMVGLINYLMTFGSASLFGIRFGANLLVFLTSIVLYFLVKENFNEKVAFWSVFLFQFLPHYLIIWLTMFVELPLALFWVISIYLTTKIIKEKKNIYWYWLGLVVGLGYLSKYTMFLYWYALAMFMFLAPDYRVWLKKKELYISLLISLCFFLPVIIWNSQNAWISFAFHSGKATSDPFGTNFLAFVGDQLIHFTPFFIIALWSAFKFSLKKDDINKLLFSFSAPILLFFLILSFKVKIWAHWPAIAYIPAIPLVINYLIETNKSLKKFISWIIGFLIILLIVLFFVTPGILLHQKDYAANYQLKTKISPSMKVFAKTNVSASLLEFYLNQPTYLATGFLKMGAPWGEKQYELWGIPNLSKGEVVIYYGDESPQFYTKANQFFEKIIELPNLKLNLIEDYITNNYKFFMLINFKGLSEHP